MKLQRFLSILVVLSLLLSGCEKKEGTYVPPPDWHPGGNTENPEDPDDPGETEEPEDPGAVTPPGAWEANRGKVVTPSGEGWTIRKVNTAVTYYAYNGKDPFHNKNQRVYAVDLDLSNPDYKVQMTYTSPSAVVSEVHKKYNAIATINAKVATQLRAVEHVHDLVNAVFDCAHQEVFVNQRLYLKRQVA